MAHDQDPGYALAASAVFLVLCVMFADVYMLYAEDKVGH